MFVLQYMPMTNASRGAASHYDLLAPTLTIQKQVEVAPLQIPAPGVTNPAANYDTCMKLVSEVIEEWKKNGFVGTVSDLHQLIAGVFASEGVLGLTLEKVKANKVIKDMIAKARVVDLVPVPGVSSALPNPPSAVPSVVAAKVKKDPTDLVDMVEIEKQKLLKKKKKMDLTREAKAQAAVELALAGVAFPSARKRKTSEEVAADERQITARRLLKKAKADEKAKIKEENMRYNAAVKVEKLAAAANKKLGPLQSGVELGKRAAALAKKMRDDAEESNQEEMQNNERRMAAVREESIEAHDDLLPEFSSRPRVEAGMWADLRTRTGIHAQNVEEHSGLLIVCVRKKPIDTPHASHVLLQFGGSGITAGPNDEVRLETTDGKWVAIRALQHITSSIADVERDEQKAAFNAQISAEVSTIVQQTLGAGSGDLGVDSDSGSEDTSGEAASKIGPPLFKRRRGRGSSSSSGADSSEESDDDSSSDDSHDDAAAEDLDTTVVLLEQEEGSEADSEADSSCGEEVTSATLPTLVPVEQRGVYSHSFAPEYSNWKGPAYVMLAFRTVSVTGKNHKMDCARIAKFKLFVGPESIVVCVASSEAPDTLTNVGLTFGTRQGDAKLVALIDSFVLASKVTILLDYFFLADKYYATNYKLKWMGVAELVCKDDRVTFVLPDNNERDVKKMSETYFAAKKDTTLMCVLDDGRGRDNPLVQSDWAVFSTGVDEISVKSESELALYVTGFATITKRPTKPP